MTTIPKAYNDDDKRLEIFCLIWLDKHGNENRDTEQKLRSIINHLKKFQDIKQCHQYIEQQSRQDRLVILVSGQLGRELVPSIHKLEQVTSIYIYCFDKDTHKKWSSKFTKVKGVVTEVNELLSLLTADHKISKKVAEPLSYNTFNGTSTMELNGEFVFNQILIDCLLKLKFTDFDENELINICQNQCKGNRTELDNINEFQQTYSSDQALQWYTRESFLYNILNGSLRNRNIHMIFLFRSIIFDIYRQLQHHQSNDSLTVYRCQMMSNEELDDVKTLVGGFISINSFFSTTKNYDQSFSFFRDTKDLERILFKISVDATMITTKPYADISQFSKFPDEGEVLFMFGSIFCIQNIHYDNDINVSIIEMSLYNNNDHALQHVLMSMKQERKETETNLQTLGNILWDMGKLNLAGKYFNRFLNQLSSDDPLRISLYNDLAKLASQQGHLDMSMGWRQKSVRLEKRNQLSVELTPKKSANRIRWKQHGITVAGGNGQEKHLNQLSHPTGIFINDAKTIYIADEWNDRIVQWKCDENKGQIIAGGNGRGCRNNQLHWPRDLIFDKQNNSLIIADRGNKRIIQWPLGMNTLHQILISDIDCYGLTMDKNGSIYVSNWDKHEVRQWKVDATEGTIVAGGNEKGYQLNQLNGPTHLFVDEDESIYVSDYFNNRVMKWRKDAKEGIVVAGNNGSGNNLKQLSLPQGVVVDNLGQIYVVDSWNDRVVRWKEGDVQGSIIVGGDRRGEKSNQLNCPNNLSFDIEGNLYVSDCGNHRIQKFEIDSN